MTIQPPGRNRCRGVVRPAATYSVMGRMAARRAAGTKVMPLNGGVPDFDTPVLECSARKSPPSFGAWSRS